MKIIGRTKDGVIVEATNNEIAQIVGKSRESWLDEKDNGVERTSDGYRASYRFKLGAEIAISPMWDWMAKARESYDKIRQSSELLRATAAILDKVPPDALTEPKEPVVK